jgi:hypothetical protein
MDKKKQHGLLNKGMGNLIGNGGGGSDHSMGGGGGG